MQQKNSIKALVMLVVCTGVTVGAKAQGSAVDVEPVSAGEEDILIIEGPAGEEADEEIMVIEGAESDEGQDMDANEIEIEDSESIVVEQPSVETVETPEASKGPGDRGADIASESQASWLDYTHIRRGNFSMGVDEVRIEYGNLYKSDSTANTSNYGHLAFSAKWVPSTQWETQLSGRLGRYYQTGDPKVNEWNLDYGESFVRYRTDQFRITAGTQKVIWGRIDEVAPEDRISRVDMGRGVLDSLPQRRRAMPVIRFEGFQEDYKLDALWLPDFRRAFLPDQDSVWFPINKQNGSILGFESTSLTRAFVKNGSISENAPSGNGGFGFRLSQTGDRFDYALTVQRVRQSTPYWQFNPEVRDASLAGADPDTAIDSSDNATFRARYPRSWVLGGDFGFEALNATWRFEAVWASQTPVTRSDSRYDTVQSANWATGVQFYPGDGDFRVNLQLVGINMIDSPSILDRKNIYNFNGSVFGEFGNNRWRTNTRFFVGLDERDIYINPELAFIAWEPHEIYVALHYFSGKEQTIGGFWEDESMLTLGWRAHF